MKDSVMVMLLSQQIYDSSHSFHSILDFDLRVGWPGPNPVSFSSETVFRIMGLWSGKFLRGKI